MVTDTQSSETRTDTRSSDRPAVSREGPVLAAIAVLLGFWLLLALGG